MSRKNVNLVFPKILGFERYIDVIFMGLPKSTTEYMLYSPPSKPKLHDRRLNATSIHIASNSTFWL
ncbi:hypothetical protein [Nostoc sp. MG11]|uniref:hypothetical protein n=1 Tax=Nostoc sp. MG11 TaxID=2721166 RepID=UPI001867B13E|nr:hypothetical protein [Nostoc sp. MG11]